MFPMRGAGLGPGGRGREGCLRRESTKRAITKALKAPRRYVAKPAILQVRTAAIGIACRRMRTDEQEIWTRAGEFKSAAALLGRTVDGVMQAAEANDCVLDVDWARWDRCKTF